MRKSLADDDRMVANRTRTVSSPKTEAKGKVHKCFVEMVVGVLRVLSHGDHLCRDILAIYPSADITVDAYDSGDTAPSSAGGFPSGFSGSSAASGMVAQ